ncbi:MAG: hypothetical protein ACKVOX_14220, partial [Rhizobacter sp.]
RNEHAGGTEAGVGAPRLRLQGAGRMAVGPVRAQGASSASEPPPSEPEPAPEPVPETPAPVPAPGAAQAPLMEAPRPPGVE